MNIPSLRSSSVFTLPSALSFILLFSGVTDAADYTWIGSGNWSSAGNWNPAGFTTGNTPVFDGTATGLTSNNDISGATIAGITFNAGAAAYTLTGNTAVLSNNITNNSSNLQTINLGMTLNGSRVLTANGGDITVNGAIGQDASARGLTKRGSGTLTLTGGNTYSGGTVLAAGAGTLKLDFAASSLASNILHSGGAVSLGSNFHVIGKAGVANTQSMGALSMQQAGYGTIRVQSGSSGSVTLNFGNMSGTSGAAINFDTDSGATITSTAAPASSGTYGSRFLWEGSDWVTGTGVGTYTLGAYTAYNTNINAGITTANTLVTGSASLSASGITTIGTLKLETTANNQDLTIGAGRTLVLSTGGGLLSVIDHDYQISGGVLRGQNSGTDLYIHQNGTGTLTISSVIDASAGARLTKTGPGILVLTGANSYGNGTSVETYITGGILSVDSNARLGNQNAATTNNIALNAGTLRATGTFALNNGSGSNRNVQLYSGGGGIDVSGSNILTVSGVVSNIVAGAGDLTKSGTGTLLLTGSNTYTSATLVNAGTLLVGDGTSGSLAGSSVSVNNGGVLGGRGTIAGPVTIHSGGTMAPGLSAGTLSIGSFSLETGGSALFELMGVSSHDILDVTGVISLAGNLTLTLGYTPAINDAFTIIQNDGGDAISGIFAGLNEGAIFTQAGQQFQISYLGGTGNDVLLTVVPEPHGAVLLGFGLSILAGRRRLKRNVK